MLRAGHLLPKGLAPGSVQGAGDPAQWPFPTVLQAFYALP